jgi:hypothetical protein
MTNDKRGGPVRWDDNGNLDAPGLGPNYGGV